VTTHTTANIKDYLNKGYRCIGEYKDERVRIEDCDDFGTLSIFIPSRQVMVWVSGRKVKLLESKRN